MVENFIGDKMDLNQNGIFLAQMIAHITLFATIVGFCFAWYKNKKRIKYIQTQDSIESKI